MSAPTPAAVTMKAREHNISRTEAKRVLAASQRVIEARKAREKEDGE